MNKHKLLKQNKNIFHSLGSSPIYITLFVFILSILILLPMTLYAPFVCIFPN